MADLVPHPLHVHVSALLTRVYASQARLTGKQVRPAVAISNGTAWVSPAATRWAGEFSPRAAGYVAAVRNLDDDLADLLRRTPATCTPEEAARWRTKLGGGHGAQT
ncbi:MAG: hypothetical protein QOG10_3519 [Kribbellaceae bacterium]|jgi:hypothetical protein|nr:hypothetical protein [Kribbellaceae bacterium]